MRLVTINFYLRNNKYVSVIYYGWEFGCVRIKSRVRSTSDLIIRIQMTAHNLSTVKLQIHIYYFNSNNVNILLFSRNKALNIKNLFVYFGCRHCLLASCQND